MFSDETCNSEAVYASDEAFVSCIAPKPHRPGDSNLKSYVATIPSQSFAERSNFVQSPILLNRPLCLVANECGLRQALEAEINDQARQLSDLVVLITLFVAAESK